MAAEEKWHLIQKGETLNKIARTYKTTVDELLRLNPKIVNRDLIFAGDKIKISGSPEPTPTNVSQRVFANPVRLQNGTDRTLFVTWVWDNSHHPTKHYEVQWQYDTGNGVWFSGSTDTTTNKYSVYTAPQNAIEVCVRVKAVPNNNEFTPGWDSWKYYNFGYPKPDTPTAPTSTITGTKLKMELSNSLFQVNDVLQLQVLQDDATTVYDKKLTVKNIDVPLVHEYKVAIGHRYRVRCRIIRKKVESDWSSYTSNMLTIPAAPTKITKLEAKSSTSVYIEWAAVTTGQVDSYDIEYATDKRYFDGSNSTTTVNNITQNHYELTGLETGQTYYFRVRAVNEKGPSDWLASDKIQSIIIGKAPAAPTTWSSTTTAIVGEPLTLYWVHNAEDNSKPTFAELEVHINDVNQNIPTIQYSASSDDEEAELTYSYSIDTSGHPAGSKIRWRVRTAGITNNFGDWSIERSIDIYAQPTLTLEVTNSNGANLSTLTSFPIKIKATAGPNTQAPIGYHIDIIANSAYETTDNFGNPKTIIAGTSVYSKHFDTTAQLSIDISASDVDLENGAEYTIKCIVAMNSGLTAEASREFEVSWTDDEYWPNASIVIDQDTLTSTIQPYCKDSDGALISGVLLSVYRREFDGGFTEIATDLNNEEGITVSDPHPALDYARYRVTATSKTTGAISYYDLPGVRVGEKAVIIQWDEEWTNFDSYGIDTPVQQPWTGSMLKLPYNIKVSDSNKPDVELIEYIGRNYPVAYYGTHRGGSQNWSVDVPSDDKETIYALRRLMNWMSDVYVREPSGSGYWANVKVSFSQDQTSVVVPVTINVTRVEGGM